MATVDDIDTQGLVSKYLQRQIVTPAADDESDTSEEIQSLLETLATSFLLTPQLVLPLILRAKNSLRQIVQNDIDILDFIIGAIADIRNPSFAIADTSDLIEAQTALVELDRLGRVGDDLQAFRRYKAAINRFLDDELAAFLKRNARKEFERSGDEAREDIFSILTQLGATHSLMASRLASLQSSISDFRSVDLTSLVSTRTVTEVRNSISRLQTLIRNDSVSKTVVAVELLAGTASLEAIADNTDVYDPTISTSLGIPSPREIYLRPEQVGATALSTEGPWDASGSDRVFALTLDTFSDNPVEFTVELPDTGVEDTGGDMAVYVVSSEDVAAATYSIPTDGTLFLRVDGASTEYQVISITSGTRTTAQILTDLNAGLTDAAAIAFKGTNRFLIYGTDPAVVSITILAGSPGEDVGTAGDPYDPYNSDPSVHDILGFEINQTSLEKGYFNAATLLDSLDGLLPGVTLELVGEQLRLTSDQSDPTLSSLQFSVTGVTDDVQDVFGFSGTVEAQPSYVELVEDSAVLLPEDVDVFLGSAFTAVEETIVGSPVRSLNGDVVTEIIGTQIYFAASVLPRGGAIEVSVSSPDVRAVQQLTQALSDFVGVFDGDVQDIQLALSPILSSPTQAQVNDALRVLNRVRDKLTNSGNGGVLEALDAVVVRLDQSPFVDQAEVLIQALEERGLDRAQDLLSTARFSEFFSLSKNDASRSSRLLRAMEQFVTTDIPIAYDEETIEDDQISEGQNPGDPLDDIETVIEYEELVEEQ
jgi:hypothetical protein